MNFNSLDYACFLALIACAYYLLPHKIRWLLLLLSSYFFYACWDWEHGGLAGDLQSWINPKSFVKTHLFSFLTLILVSTSANYFASHLVHRATRDSLRKIWLAVSLFVSLGLLFAFKYYVLFADTTNYLLAASGNETQMATSRLILPMGISFYTFQSLSYTIDVYRRKIEPEPHFGKFALYISFFPQLVAGPIERASRLLPQFHEPKRLDVAKIESGLRLILWGLFKKMVIADRLADFVQLVYGNVDGYSGTTVLLATYFFAFQIYCDFSGYSDIAIGSARIFGFDLMQNFNLPYLSKSISEFWSRWHISLSTWFRDYVYIPLGGSRVSAGRWSTNIMIVFLVSGLWHGAAWTFVVWGAIHGCCYLIERAWENLTQKLPEPPQTIKRIGAVAKIFLTFHVVLFSWVFFISDSIAEAWQATFKIATGIFDPVYYGSSTVEALISIGLIGLLIVIQILQYWKIAPFYGQPGRCQPLWYWGGTIFWRLEF